MDLKLKNDHFLVCGASSGFGNAVARALISEGAKITAIARRKDALEELKSLAPSQISILAVDLTDSALFPEIKDLIDRNNFKGALINAGGPPAKSTLETEIDDWDDAYFQLVRWKILLTRALLPKMQKNNYGKIVYVESISVKQPVENLVLSNSMRLAVVGFVKTLSSEISGSGVNLNIMAPGYHETAALERLYRKKSEAAGISFEEARSHFREMIPLKRTGDTDEFASLALWLLSPLSSYITGQTISVDGGVMRYVFG